jgi:hypothetical protein
MQPGSVQLGAVLSAAAAADEATSDKTMSLMPVCGCSQATHDAAGPSATAAAAAPQQGTSSPADVKCEDHTRSNGISSSRRSSGSESDSLGSSNSRSSSFVCVCETYIGKPFGSFVERCRSTEHEEASTTWEAHSSEHGSQHDIVVQGASGGDCYFIPFPEAPDHYPAGGRGECKSQELEQLLLAEVNE